MDMKPTAVEWLYLQLIKNPKTPWNDILQEAKEMEKEQIIDAFNSYPIAVMNAEQYYNENFKSEYNEKTKI
jgi:hypothetical protein